MTRRTAGRDDQARRNQQFLRDAPFLNGIFLKENDAEGDKKDSITMSHGETKVLRHGLGRSPGGYMIVGALHSSTGTGHTIVQVVNPNGESADEFIAFYASSTGGVTVDYKIWIY